MRLLIIGGTQFVGRHLVEAAIASGHQVTLFNRGKTHPDLFGNIEKLRGDRDGGLFALRGRSWDAVIDTCGYLPRVVRQSAELLCKNVPHYIYISSASVYDLPSVPTRIEESAPLATAADPSAEEITWQTYGPLKALCEAAVQNSYPQGALIVRPGIFAGPYDPTDRFTYWVFRTAYGGTVAAPGDGTQPVQLIDARDLAAWVVSMIERKKTGIFNAVGPALPLTMKRFLEECKFGTGNVCELAWVPDQKLLQAGIGEQIHLPFWLSKREDYSLFCVDSMRAISEKLTVRPLSATITDVHKWIAAMQPPFRPKVGLTPQLEAQLLSGVPAG